MRLAAEERAEILLAARDGAALTEARVDAAAAALPEALRARRALSRSPALQLQADLELVAAAGDAGALAAWLGALVAQATGPGRARLEAFARRRLGPGAAPALALERPIELPEAMVFADDTVPVGFLSRGLAASASVACVAVPAFEGASARPGLPACGTAWLLTERHVATCAHVVHARAAGARAAPDELARQALAATVHFGWEGLERRGEGLAIARLAALDDELDVAVLELAAPAPAPPLRCATARVERPTSEDGRWVNVIQHPGGGEKRVALRASTLVDATEDDLFYFSDTAGGSSGAPVLDDDWAVVGLHRAAVPRPGARYLGRALGFVNAGRQITRVLAWLARAAPDVRAGVP